MGNRERIAGLVLAAILLCTRGARAESGRWVAFEFPKDSPVLVSSFSMGPTTARVQGSSMAVDLHAVLTLQNTSAKPIAGLTLRVEAQDVGAGGKASVTLASLDAAPGDSFPVHLDVRLSRPFGVSAAGPIIQVSLDCALFSDLSAYGPDTLGSRRLLAVYEMEARRDRRYLARLLQSGRTAEVRRELNFGLQDAFAAQLGLELLSGSSLRGQPFYVGALTFGDAPVRPAGGTARVFANEIGASRVELVNQTKKSVRSVDLGWIVRDVQGREFVAGSIPVTGSIAPVQTAVMSEPGTLRLMRRGGEPVAIGAITSFIGDVEFADGTVWIPTREDIEASTSDPDLRRQLAASPEEQHLGAVYRSRGLEGVEQELAREERTEAAAGVFPAK
jgi:hypothetical protein